MKILFTIFLVTFFTLINTKKLEYSFETSGGKNFLVIKSPSKNKKS